MNEAPLEILFFILVCLILCSAFFSSSETAMMSLNRYRLKHLVGKNNRGAKRAEQLLERPDRLIGLILIGNNLVNIFATSIATVIAMRLYGDAGIAIGGVLLTLVILLFAEVTPKTLAAYYPEKIAFPFTLVLKPLLTILYPAVWLINILSNNLLKLFGISADSKNEQQLSREELRTIVNEASPHITSRHQGMLTNILDLENATAEDIMIPRNEVLGLDLDDDDDALVAQLRSSAFTRLPVFKEDINNIIGLLHLKYVSQCFDQQGQFNRQAMMDMISPPYFVLENTPLHTQLFNFQQEKKRLGVVVDEYGVMQGLVTLEDILEEIVGEFTSNIADNIEEIFPQKDDSYIINGTINIRDINKTLNWQLPTDGPKTLNGLLLEHLETFPDAVACIGIGDYGFEVLEISENIIQTARGIALKK